MRYGTGLYNSGTWNGAEVVAVDELGTFRGGLSGYSVFAGDMMGSSVFAGGLAGFSVFRGDMTGSSVFRGGLTGASALTGDNTGGES